MAVEVVIDGKERFQWGLTTRERSLSVGKHTIAFIPKDKKRFVEEQWKVNIPPGDKPFKFRRRLRWRPAELFVESNVDAVVTVPGRAADKANKRFEIGIKKGPKEKISVLVSSEGYIPKTKQVTITAGELARLKVNLRKK